MTIHKSQGQTLPQVVVDLGTAEKAAGISFGAISRVRSLQHLVLQPMSFKRLQAIGKSKHLQERLREEERLRNLAQVTALRYEHLKPICVKNQHLKGSNFLINLRLTLGPPKTYPLTKLNNFSVTNTT